MNNSCLAKNSNICFFHHLKFVNLAMSTLDLEITKLYYSIGEVSEMFDVNASLIRFWEKEFSIIKPKKNKKGNRLFTAKDIENLRRIYDLVKIQGFTLEGAKSQLKQKSESSSSPKEVIKKLEEIKANLLGLKKDF
ncbi:MAG: DNA-binding transcriptional MerR regulator [Arenicella sp.]